MNNSIVMMINYTDNQSAIFALVHLTKYNDTKMAAMLAIGTANHIPGAPKTCGRLTKPIITKIKLYDIEIINEILGF